MRLTFLILLVAFLKFNCMAQSAKLFDIRETIIAETVHKKTPNNFNRESSNFFEDNDYVVRKTCSGEWGGTIWFKNKKTGNEYSCSATCPVIVNKLNGKYIVTATLNHLSGFSQILEIDNPQKLSIFKMPKPKMKNGKTQIRYVGDGESRSTKGAKALLDTIGVSTILTFPYKNQLYHIITNYKNTFVAKIENKRFVIVDSLSKKSFWSYNSEVYNTTDKHFVAFFNNENVEGYIDVFDNKIDIIRYR